MGKVRRRRQETAGYNGSMEALNLVQQLSVLVIPVLLAITVHEAAHGWAAKRLGDPTAHMLGRVSLNPLRHIDPVGTLLVPLVGYWLSGFLFGWAKPVPINPRNLRQPRRDEALVALAGPGANLIMAILWSLTIEAGRLAWPVSEWMALPLIYTGAAGVVINSILLVINLLPVLPLDGGRVLSFLLPAPLARPFRLLEPYGFVIIILLLVTGVLSRVISPLIAVLIDALPNSDLVFQLFF